MGGEPVHPFGFVEILRHVDVDLDEDEPFKLVGLRHDWRGRPRVQSRLSAGASFAQE